MTPPAAPPAAHSGLVGKRAITKPSRLRCRLCAPHDDGRRQARPSDRATLHVQVCRRTLARVGEDRDCVRSLCGRATTVILPWDSAPPPLAVACLRETLYCSPPARLASRSVHIISRRHERAPHRASCCVLEERAGPPLQAPTAAAAVRDVSGRIPHCTVRTAPAARCPPPAAAPANAPPCSVRSAVVAIETPVKKACCL